MSRQMGEIAYHFADRYGVNLRERNCGPTVQAADHLLVARLLDGFGPQTVFVLNDCSESDSIERLEMVVNPSTVAGVAASPAEFLQAKSDSVWSKAQRRFALRNPLLGYKRLPWKLIDAQVVGLKPHQVYEILAAAELLSRREAVSEAPRAPEPP